MTPRERAVQALDRGEPLRKTTGYGEQRISEIEAAGLTIVDPQAGTDALLEAILGPLTAPVEPEPVDGVRQRVETALAAWIADPARLRAVAGDVIDLAQRTLLGEVEDGHPFPREHRVPDLLGVRGHPFAEWRVPTDGEGADSRVVLTQVDRRGCRTDAPPVLMIRAQALPQSDVPGLLEAVAAAGAYSFEGQA